MIRIQRNHIDLSTLIAVLILMVVSVGVVYSASAELAYKRFENMDHYLDLHAVKILLGLLSQGNIMSIDNDALYGRII